MGFWREGEARTEESHIGGRQSGGVDSVEFFFKQLFRGMVAQNLSRQGVNPVGKKRDVLYAIIRNVLPLGNEPTEHPVMTFVCALLP